MHPVEAENLVSRFGGIRKAARAIGVPYSTFWGWLHTDYEAARCAEGKKWEQQAEKQLAYTMYKTRYYCQRRVDLAQERRAALDVELEAERAAWELEN